MTKDAVSTLSSKVNKPLLEYRLIEFSLFLKVMKEKIVICRSTTSIYISPLLKKGE